MSLKTYENIKSINLRIKSTLAGDLELSRSFYVKGELSNMSYSGRNIFFTLKDETGEIPCAVWDYASLGIKRDLKNGQAVIVRGSIDVWPNKGTYRLIATGISLDGEGKLAEEFERLRKKLEAEGLFDEAYKKPIPKFPKVVGIVTSKDGEAINDIVNMAYSKNPYIRFVVYPAKVQGIGAAESIVQGIKILDTMDMDVIIVGRGGGSMEDRWAFNEEIVVRAIFAANTPIISAVGHEQNFHLSDFVADVRAKTPTDAGDMIAISYEEIVGQLYDIRQRLHRQLSNRLDNARLQLDNYCARLEGLSPKRRLENQHKQLELHHNNIKNAMLTKYNRYSSYLDNAQTRIKASSPDKLLAKRAQEFDVLRANLHRGMGDKYNRSFQEYRLLLSKLHALSPTAKLTNGFGYISHKDKAVDSIKDVAKGDVLTLRISDGVIDTVVDKVTEDRIS